MLDTILKNLGIYDLIAVLLVGLIANFSLFVQCAIFSQLEIDALLGLADKILNIPNIWIIIFLMSYLLGIILQSIGGVIQRGLRGIEAFIYNRRKGGKHGYNDIAVYKIFEQSKSLFRNCYLSKTEREKVKRKLGEAYKSTDFEYNYNHIKYLVRQTRESFGDNQQAIAAFSRSIAVLFGILALSFSIYYILKTPTDNRNSIEGVMLIFDFLMAVLMWARSERFFRLRYVNILREYIYNTKSE